MEILLLHDVTNVGKKNDLVIVGDGYAMNFLLPRRLALVATPVVRRRFADVIRHRAEERERERQNQLGISASLRDKTVTLARKVTKTGKLYAAISEEAIAEAINEQLSIEIPATAIDVAEPIKATGTFTVSVELAGQVAPLKVTVTAEA